MEDCNWVHLIKFSFREKMYFIALNGMFVLWCAAAFEPSGMQLGRELLHNGMKAEIRSV